jgi:sec-independent protein translocase protein TatA
MFRFGTTEVILLAILLVLLFGAKKIPELARGIGEAIRLLRGGFSDDGKEDTTKNR